MNGILIVDDHEVVRRGLAWMLKNAVPAAAIGEASTAEEAARLLEKQNWSLMILDVGLPDRSGLDFLGEALRLRPALPVLVLTGLPDEEIAIRVFKAGAMGYLGKGCTEGELVDAARRLLAGGRYLTAAVAEQVAARLCQRSRKTAREPLADVSGRMFDVLLLLGRGDTVKEAASTLGLSGKTVSTYRRRLLDRLELKSSADIVRYCMRRGLTQ